MSEITFTVAEARGPATAASNPTFLDRIDALTTAILAQPGAHRFALRCRPGRDGFRLPAALRRKLVARTA